MDNKGLLPQQSLNLLNGLQVRFVRSEEHTSELQSRQYLVCRLLLEKKSNMLLPLLPPECLLHPATSALSLSHPSSDLPHTPLCSCSLVFLPSLPFVLPWHRPPVPDL